MSIFYYLPALIGIVFIIVGTYHGWSSAASSAAARLLLRVRYWA